MHSSFLSNNIRIANTQQEEVHEFYTTKLGMVSTQTENLEIFLYQFEPGTNQDCALQIHYSNQVTEGYVPSKESIYWKIGIAVDDLDAFVSQLTAKGLEVGPAKQFLDIGYMWHLQDPAGFTIELIQTTFESSIEERNILIQQPRPPVLLHITIRTQDIAKMQDIAELMGMKCLSVQPVEVYNFTLYFYAWTDDIPPHADNLEHVGNREWAWQRKYTELEVQLTEASLTASIPEHQAGFEGITILPSDTMWDQLAPKMQILSENQGELIGPDGLRITVKKPTII